ncbi:MULTISPECIES: RHS repeat domain-containing protein [unclassified Pseudomonas]|uniref:RHS repeat domain-containing protein n=1 Tax=unclassified Pseudomonas TaxID=196821 RepID=UPI0011B52515|nr:MULTISPECIES: RHS repeat protein [unclassified Pseudomonas]MDW3716117.1 RHS repeat protein [Pseudomonas sp. 2023EL-01195]
MNHKDIQKNWNPLLYLAILLTSSQNASATTYYWRVATLEFGVHANKSPVAACSSYASTRNWPYYGIELYTFDGKCTFKDQSGSWRTEIIYRIGDSCQTNSSYNPLTGECEAPDPDLAASPKGMPDEATCPLAGNTIVFSTGNKIQTEDLLPNLNLFYNSSDGVWRHNYSDQITTQDNHITITKNDGKAVHFTNAGNPLLTPNLPRTGSLIIENGLFTYITQENKILNFDSSGRLSRVISNDETTYINQSADTTIIKLPTKEIELKTRNTALLSAKLGDIKIDLTYNAHGKLSRLNYSNGETRNYFYDDPRNPNLLTGITDERGIRYATWAYDDQGRAISSEHAGGAERTLVSYNADGSSTVTNALGKRTTYRFQTIQGIRRITAIEGEPSANCPNSNSTFTYDDRGLVKTRTDNKGNVTTFDYNDRGLEVSRTEAYGTPQARTVTTTWHPTLFLPASVTEPDRITTYSYDDQGRPLSQSVSPR